MKKMLSLLFLSFALIAAMGNYSNHESKKQSHDTYIFASDVSPTDVASFDLNVIDLNGAAISETPKYAFCSDDYEGEAVRGYKPGIIASCNSPT